MMDKDEIDNMTKKELQDYVVDVLGCAVTKPNAPSNHVRREVVDLLHELAPPPSLPYDVAVQMIDGDE